MLKLLLINNDNKVFFVVFSTNSRKTLVGEVVNREVPEASSEERGRLIDQVCSVFRRLEESYPGKGLDFLIKMHLQGSGALGGTMAGLAKLGIQDPRVPGIVMGVLGASRCCFKQIQGVEEVSGSLSCQNKTFLTVSLPVTFVQQVFGGYGAARNFLLECGVEEELVDKIAVGVGLSCFVCWASKNIQAFQGGNPETSKVLSVFYALTEAHLEGAPGGMGAAAAIFSLASPYLETEDGVREAFVYGMATLCFLRFIYQHVPVARERPEQSMSAIRGEDLEKGGSSSARIRGASVQELASSTRKISSSGSP